jgi:SAM-dependent methyltransferase
MLDMTQTLTHNISFPLTEPGALDQDEAFFHLFEDGVERRLRFHDYGPIYQRPGLYEQLFYQRLQCASPTKAVDVLGKVLTDNRVEISSLRVLDLGAGNGMMGELLNAARVVGVDILEEAKQACDRDRPHAYDAYYVADLTSPDPKVEAQLKMWQFDCLSCIAALGYGDIPVPAFANAMNLVQDQGWLVFNIKEDFMRSGDRTGFSRLIDALMRLGVLEIHHLERYRHRVSIDGRPLFYFVVVARKVADVAPDVVDRAMRP